MPPLLRAVELYEEDSEQWAIQCGTLFFTYGSLTAGGTGALPPLPGWMTHLEVRLEHAERCTVAAPSSMQCWAMLGMALAEQEADLGRAAQALMKAATLTDVEATKSGYLRFARGLLQQLQASAPAQARHDDGPSPS